MIQRPPRDTRTDTHFPDPTVADLTSISAPGEEVANLPAAVNHHWTKSLAASPDGTKLYVGIGSNSNVGERGMSVEEDRAVIWEIDAATGADRKSTRLNSSH